MGGGGGGGEGWGEKKKKERKSCHHQTDPFNPFLFTTHHLLVYLIRPSVYLSLPLSSQLYFLRAHASCLPYVVEEKKKMNKNNFISSFFSLRKIVKSWQQWQCHMLVAALTAKREEKEEDRRRKRYDETNILGFHEWGEVSWWQLTQLRSIIFPVVPTTRKTTTTACFVLIQLHHSHFLLLFFFLFQLAVMGHNAVVHCSR